MGTEVRAPLPDSHGRQMETVTKNGFLRQFLRIFPFLTATSAALSVVSQGCGVGHGQSAGSRCRNPDLVLLAQVA